MHWRRQSFSRPAQQPSMGQSFAHPAAAGTQEQLTNQTITQLAGTFVPIELTNKTGVDLDIGDVVAISTTPGSVVLDDRVKSTHRFVVATERIARDAQGIFGTGAVRVKVTGAASYGAGGVLTKSATSRALEPYATTAYVTGRWMLPAGALGFLTDAASSESLRQAMFWGVGAAPDPVADADVVISEDFLGSGVSGVPGTGAIRHYAYPWWWTGSTPAVSTLVHGVARCVGDATTAGSFFLSIGSSTVSLLTNVVTNGLAPRFRTRWAQRTATAGTRRIGLMSAFGTGEPADGLYFRHTAGGSYLAVARAASVESTLTLPASASADVYEDMEMIVNAAGTSVEVYSSGTYVGALTSNIPTADLGIGGSNSSITNLVGFSVDRLVCRWNRI